MHFLQSTTWDGAVARRWRAGVGGHELLSGFRKMCDPSLETKENKRLVAESETSYDECSMWLRFNEAKATQAAARFLRLQSGRMNYMKLIKLLYLLDRSALLAWGRPVTTDRYVSMQRGPVVSRILDLILEEPEPGSVSYWRRHISGRKAYSVRLVSDPGSDELSRAEEDLIDTVFAEHGYKSQWELVDFCHRLPEWKDPEGSSIPLGYADILRAGEKTEDEIREVVAELNALAAAEIRYSPA
jgi:uncharacterized phage-associated protein